MVAIAACAEAIANNLVFAQTNSHPDYRDRRQPLQKINDAGDALARTSGKAFVPLKEGQAIYDALDRVRGLRNTFMHAKEIDDGVDPTTLTATVFTKVDEASCRGYLMNLRLAVEDVYGQLTGQTPPIVTHGNVRWLGDIEVP